ncbi:MAG: ferritin-like domain-containing protein, partial [Pseudomonadota bacterium]
ARPDQIDHFEINWRWQELNFVIEGREIGEAYTPPPPQPAQPYKDAAEMIDELESHLASMEITLCIEYLYSLFTLRAPDEAPKDAWPTMAADLLAVRQSLTLVAVSEMTHLRWVNQLLWELDRAGCYPPGRHYTPIVTPDASQPIGHGRAHQPALRPLDFEALDAYVRVERPGGPLDRAYARCVATLEYHGYPRHLYELAVKIDTDGTQHWERFREMRRILGTYRHAWPLPYLRPVTLGTPEQAARALAAYQSLQAALAEAYTHEAARRFEQAQACITAARQTMDLLNREAEALAAQGIGIPFFSVP